MFLILDIKIIDEIDYERKMKKLGKEDLSHHFSIVVSLFNCFLLKL